ncbi:Glycosyltransferase family 92 [Mucilaginibacter mallensis]|uniref:Glycosyltransferase family 92 n=1 Tax=Mucilaginibacter mallensis TaxID=652787 RepID=A0A1H2ABD0_MUCMA|nr:glycosyltransferase family 92 protein [Mucilaginibacter mallensis]SDT43290.1 Glycosyltransferase family 92 [Mucilaginibacter mallensis]
MTISIHTIFILRENILFLEEWIDYHAALGIRKFTLYDNSKSQGYDGSSPGINKYKYDFKQLTNFISDAELDLLLGKILSKYGNMITYIKWEPTDGNGNIIFGQKECIIHYIENFGQRSEWTAFIDIDEFIYCKGSLMQWIKKFDARNVGDILLLQKKFDDRFNNLDKSVTHIVKCIDNIDTSLWGPKHIIKNNNFDVLETGAWNIHSLPAKGGFCVIAKLSDLRFNHYNVNDWQLNWMKNFYKTHLDFSLNAECFKLSIKAKRLKIYQI